MAGTRRRVRRQRSVSQAASIVRERADPEPPSKVIEIADSASEPSPRPDSPLHRSTTGFCRACGSCAGEWYNAWRKVTGSYYLPLMRGSYLSRLKTTGLHRNASRHSKLHGCTIQPLSCPGPSCGDPLIGFTVVDAPPDKRNFRDRDFFKLTHIELRCEVAGRTTVVTPHEDDTPDFLSDNDSDTSTPAPRPLSIASADNMEIDSRPPVSQHHAPHLGRHDHFDHHQHSQPLQQVEANRQSLPPPAAVRSPQSLPPLQSITQKPVATSLPSVSPAVKAIHDVSHPIQSRDPPPLATSGPRDLPPPTHSRSPAESTQRNGYFNPRSPRDASLDAMERLQAQVSQNTSALAAHTRDIRRGEEMFQQLDDNLRREFQVQIQRQSNDIQRVDEAVALLHKEMETMKQVMEGFGRELHAIHSERSRAPVMASGPPSAQDSALELMAQQVAIISQKTNEVDTLKITIEIMKNKIQRLEDGPAGEHIQHIPASAFHSRRGSEVHVAQPGHPVAVYHAVPSAVQNSAGRPPYNPTAAPPPETPRGPDDGQQGAGWATVNAGVKRTYSNGAQSPTEGAAHHPDSPKRQRLAGLESHAAYASSQGHPPQHIYDHVAANGSDPRIRAPPHTLPSQHHVPDASQPPHSSYIPANASDGISEEVWRAEAQRQIEHRPRGRGRGGGPGSRGGRVRKGMASQLHPLTTPEWDKNEWHGDLQASPDSYYRGRGIARRGSGGGGRGGYTPSDRAISIDIQGTPSGTPHDPYAHTKKTRTKPIRNADGVLIRKDGRPDMRSQSSAANLRKVHARKDGDPPGKESPSSFTPSNLAYSTASAPHTSETPETPSPTGSAPPGEQDLSASVHRKHTAIMGKMFPAGVDASRKKHDLAHQVFEEDRESSGTAHPRAKEPHHRAEAVQGKRIAGSIKKEGGEGEASTSEEDVEMDSPEEEQHGNETEGGEEVELEMGNHGVALQHGESPTQPLVGEAATGPRPTQPVPEIK